MLTVSLTKLKIKLLIYGKLFLTFYESMSQRDQKKNQHHKYLTIIVKIILLWN